MDQLKMFSASQGALLNLTRSTTCDWIETNCGCADNHLRIILNFNGGFFSFNGMDKEKHFIERENKTLILIFNLILKEYI